MSKSDLNNTHYSYTPGYQPSKTAESGTLNPPKGETGLPLPPEFLHNISVQLDKPSDIELRIRKEVMDDVNKMIEYEADEEEYHKSILLRIKDRLNLLWGDK